ncbi:PspC domain-containing protein [Nonomuraea aurantiaca]|jgi:phage shock protein PspC (stress-responsive transcriptional regulator)|uniref:PspC domain-containing protein n=1 Tax=Nonomuraea aurantiaca TaxID=2878562 RepID=UPI001CD94062|nr:PspC domain-containing protein [Nonomuraea aurantiaca]MCA2228997.1 PspC domain-containing protein [Nonomuraea aurantiaca]
MSEYNVKQLRRTNNGRVIAGVCSGIGEYLGIDANLIRIGLAVVTLFGGLGVGVYAIGWLLMPDEDRNTSIAQDLLNKQQAKSTWQDGTDYYRGEQKPQQ